VSLDLSTLRPLQAMAAAILFKRRRLLLCLPRQKGGKTELGVRCIHDITSRPFTTSSLFLAKSRPAAKKATREKFMRIFDTKIFCVNTETVYLKAFPTSCCFIESVDKDPDRLRGGTYSFIHWSEVAFSRLEGGETIQGVFDKVIQPTLSETRGYVLLESTNNGKNGWYDLWEKAEEYGFSRLKVSLSDMVYLGLVTREDYESIRATTHPDVFKQEYECEWITFAGRVYPEFLGVHIQECPPPEDWQTVISGIDWGYDPSATCALYGYKKADTVYIFHEHYALRERAADTAEAIDLTRVSYAIQTLAAVGDHEEDRIEELNRRGIQCGKARKADVMGVRMQIKEMFWANRLVIHPRCANLIKDLQAATWHPKKEGELDDTQCTWGHFDAEAALRYLIRELSEITDNEPDKPETSQITAAANQLREIGRCQP
jgi:hypothetical protein